LLLDSLGSDQDAASVDPDQMAQIKHVYMEKVLSHISLFFMQYDQILHCHSVEKIHQAPKMIKLRMVTSLKSQGSDWLKWRLVSISDNQMLEI
jgi:hypothetical protein